MGQDGSHFLFPGLRTAALAFFLMKFINKSDKRNRESVKRINTLELTLPQLKTLDLLHCNPPQALEIQKPLHFLL